MPPTLPKSSDSGELRNYRAHQLMIETLFRGLPDYQVKNYNRVIAGCRILEISGKIRKTVDSISERMS